MPDRRTRVIRVTFESPPDPDRFHPKERCRFAVVVLFPEEVKRQLATATVAKARALEIGRKMIEDQLCNPPDLDALNAWAEVVTLDLFPLGEVHRTLDDGKGLADRGGTVLSELRQREGAGAQFVFTLRHSRWQAAAV